MKKYYIILCSIVVVVNLANSQTYETKFKTDICACIEEEVVNAIVLKTVLEKCFRQELTTYAELIDAEIDEDNINLKYQKGQLARRELFKKFKYEMVYSCDFYFNTLVARRQKTLEKNRLKTDSTSLERLNQRVAMSPNSSSYFARAKTQFTLRNLKAAEKDIRESIRIHPSTDKDIYTIKEKLLLAVILEEQKQFKEAILIYNEAYETTKDADATVLSAIANRKSGGVNVVPISQKNSTKSIKEKDVKRTQKKDSKSSPKKKANRSELRSLFNLVKKEKDTSKSKTRKRRSRGNKDIYQTIN
tara:strand:- start:3570 stop:4478 length:909 start_codon:yes stop_codon:yes gene_type:complete